MSDRRTEYSPSHNHCKRTIIPRPAPTLPKPHYPLLCTITLASLVKGRWIDGKAQALILLLSACDMPTIFMLQIFCRQDGGIASPPPFAPHQPFQNRTITLAFRSAIVCVCLYGFAFKLSHLAFRRARGLPLPLHRTYLSPRPL